MTNSKSAANAILTMDIMKSVVGFANNPESLGYNLTKHLRELIGASCIFMSRFTDLETRDYDIIGLYPERKRKLVDISCVDYVIRKMNKKSGYEIFKFDSDSDLHIALNSNGVRNLALIPLVNNNQLLGLIGIVNLMEVDFGNNIIQSFTELSNLIASIMMISMGFEAQEKLIENRTKELIIAKDEAELANRVKSQFLSNMSHEIRTPMNGIMGINQYILTTALSEEQQAMLEISQRSSESLLRIINDILDYSKLEAGEMTLINKVFNIHDLLNDIQKTFNFQAKEKFIGFDVAPLYTKVSDFYSDFERIKQILVNLISNAIKFTENGSVSLETAIEVLEEDTAKLNISVKDTGCGIEEESFELIFNRFSQLDLSPSKKYQGTGLGLAITKSLVELLDGKITMKSTLGKGSHFKVSLPLKIHKEPQNRNMDKKSNRSVKGQKVLITDDDAVNRMIVSKVLQEAGYQVYIATNGQEALEIMDREVMDIVLMDIQMPVMDGITASNEIKKSNNKSKIIAMTAYASEMDKDKILKAGLDDYIRKPIEFEELKELVLKWENYH